MLNKQTLDDFTPEELDAIWKELDRHDPPFRAAPRLGQDDGSIFQGLDQ